MDDENTDEVIEEIHRTRKAISDRFGGDINAIAEDAARRQAEENRPIWIPPSPSTMLTTISRQVHVPDEIPLVRQLFREYQSQLGFDLGFQNFEQELRNLPGAYAPPSGALFLAFDNDVPVGCVALREMGDGRGEIKRLFVRPAARGGGIGRALVTHVLDEAKKIGYGEVVLDTIETMTAANRLYESLGFTDILPYCPNPIEGARFLGKRFDVV